MNSDCIDNCLIYTFDKQVYVEKYQFSPLAATGLRGGGFLGASLMYLALLGFALACDPEVEGEHHCSPLIPDTRYIRLPTAKPKPPKIEVTRVHGGIDKRKYMTNLL